MRLAPNIAKLFQLFSKLVLKKSSYVMLLILIIVSLHIMYLSLWEAHCICVWFYSLFKLQTLQLLSMRKLDLSISAGERKQNWVLVTPVFSSFVFAAR